MSVDAPIDPKIQEIQPRDVKSLMGEIDAGRGVRLVRTGRVGHEHIQERPIAASLEEARKRGWDWWDSTKQSWVRLGTFYERNYFDMGDKIFLGNRERPATKPVAHDPDY